MLAFYYSRSTTTQAMFASDMPFQEKLSGRVLLLESNAHLARLLGFVLKRLSLEVDFTCDFDVFQDMLRQREYEVVMLEPRAHLNELDEMLAGIRADRPGRPVLLLSEGEAPAHSCTNALFLAKPFSMVELKEQLRPLLVTAT